MVDTYFLPGAAQSIWNGKLVHPQDDYPSAGQVQWDAYKSRFKKECGEVGVK